MLDKLSDTLGVNSESLDALMATEPAPAPPADAPPPPPPQPSFQSRPRSASEALAQYRKPAAIKAIELLLRNPEIALAVNTEAIEPMRNAEDLNRKQLLELIEKVHTKPQIEIPELYGICMATHLSGHLTALQKSEKITPQEGIEDEFLQIIDNILSDIQKKLHILQLKEEANTRVSAANKGNQDGINPV